MSSTFIHTSTGFVFKTFVIAEFELRKLRHDFTELITRALQPALWLLIFGQVFARSGMMHTGSIPYPDFHTFRKRKHPRPRHGLCSHRVDDDRLRSHRRTLISPIGSVNALPQSPPMDQ
jgi:hypothetical protein